MPTATIRLAGLSAPAAIHLDRWGIPHIRAGNLADLFFVQGANAARDRLWQIDLWRKRGLGLLAADFGPGYLMQDRAARLFLYRGDMAPEWAAYGEDAEAICTAFANGVNAWVAEVLAGRQPMPPEFAALGTRPALWAPEDVVRIRTHCLSRNADSEFARLRVLRRADAPTDLLRQALTPAVPDSEWALAAPQDLPDTALTVYHLATAPVTFAPERLAAGLADAGRWSAVDARKLVIAEDGSNNWAIAPQHSATGRAIMASDPHRAQASPSLRYLVHLSAPGIDLIGAGEPSSPGIMAGHNGHSAFSLTIFCGDQEDVLVHDTGPQGYRDGAGWRAFDQLVESIPVKGHPDQPMALRFTRHGPVVHEGEGVVVSIRTVFTDPGTAPYMAALKSMRATSFSEFRSALASWGAPTVNQVYADVTGSIGWQAAGYFPRRDGWRGLVPMPGDGRYEWQGYRTAAEMPWSEDPASGFVYSANEMNLPADWPHDSAPIGHEWAIDGRAERIAQVLAQPGQDVADCCALQCDTRSLHALRMVALLPAEAPMADLLHGWDGHVDVNSNAALLYELWFAAHLRPALLARVAPDPALRKLLAPGSILTVIETCEGGHPALSAGIDLPALLRETLAAAVEDASDRFGADPAGWRWGDLHQGWFGHAVADLAPQVALDVGPLAKGGSTTTVMLASYEAGDWKVRHGASVRMVVDVGAWDNSRAINAPGQSGDPASPHHADLAPLWARGEYVPMLYSTAAVDEATVSVLSLVPAGG